MGWEGVGTGSLLHCPAALAFSLMHEPLLSCSAPLHTAQRAMSNAGGAGTSGESKGLAFGEDWPHQLGVLLSVAWEMSPILKTKMPFHKPTPKVNAFSAVRGAPHVFRANQIVVMLVIMMTTDIYCYLGPDFMQRLKEGKSVNFAKRKRATY